MKNIVKKAGLILVGLGIIINYSLASLAINIKGDLSYKKEFITDMTIEAEEKEKELRAVWVSSVYNLDFPSKKAMTEVEFKKEYLRLLDNVEDLNLNSVIFQVRPKGDSFYKSKINPWSEYLTGVEGKSPGWDPLAWMIDETHKRGLEFQAWFNPYRVTTNQSNNTSKLEDLRKLSKLNYARKNPDKVFKWKGKLYLNPGDPEVINYLEKL